MIPAHSYGKLSPGAKLEEKGCSLCRFRGKEYLVKMKCWDLHGKQYVTYDILGEARFGTAGKAGEKRAGARLERQLKATRALANAIRRNAGIPIEETKGNLFYKPIPRSIAGNAVKEQMLEAIFFGTFLSGMRSDALYLSYSGPIEQEYLNFLPYKPKPEEICRN